MKLKEIKAIPKPETANTSNLAETRKAVFAHVFMVVMREGSAKEDNLAIAQYLLDEKLVDPNMGEGKNTPLLIAIHNADLPMVKLLYEKGAIAKDKSAFKDIMLEKKDTLETASDDLAHTIIRVASAVESGERTASTTPQRQRSRQQSQAEYKKLFKKSEGINDSSEEEKDPPSTPRKK